MTINLDVVTGLHDVDAIKHVEEALPFEGNLELVIDQIQENIYSAFVGCSDGKVVDLSFEDDTLAGDSTGVEAWFVGSRCEAEFLEYRVRMLLPETGGFRVPLHRRKDRYNVTQRDWGAFLVVHPLFVERAIWSDEEPLFRWRRLSKGIRDIGSKYKEVFSGSDGVE